MLQFRTAAASHVGLVRADNEDSAFAGSRLVVVADGMGGAAGGEIASAVAVHAADRESRLAGDAAAPRGLMERAVAHAAALIRTAVEADSALKGMGTTFTALQTDGTRVVLAHVGDSRAYLYRAGTLAQVSDDHTLVQSMVEAGRLSPAQARRSEHRHILLRSLGGGGPSDPDLLDLDLVGGDRLLLCSDGLSDLVDDDDLARLLALPDADTVVDLLVASALEVGGTDNITCVVVDVVEVLDGGHGPHRGAFFGAAQLPTPSVG